MKKLFIEPTFTLDEAERVIAALEASQEHEIAKKVRRTLDIDRRHFEAQEAARKAEEELRAKRAENHVLTKRQAECLAAVRAGKRATEQPYYWTDENGVKQWRWRWSHSMGGAVCRMIEKLVDEGMLTESDDLTAAGRERLEQWEAKNGKIGGEV